MSYDRDILMGQVKTKILSLNKSSVFTLYDILNDFDYYSQLSNSDKMSFGKFFKNEVDSNNFSLVVLNNKKIGNRLSYIKK